MVNSIDAIMSSALNVCHTRSRLFFQPQSLESYSKTAADYITWLNGIRPEQSPELSVSSSSPNMHAGSDFCATGLRRKPVKNPALCRNRKPYLYEGSFWEGAGRSSGATRLHDDAHSKDK